MKLRRAGQTVGDRDWACGLSVQLLTGKCTHTHTFIVVEFIQFLSICLGQRAVIKVVAVTSVCECECLCVCSTLTYTRTPRLQGPVLGLWLTCKEVGEMIISAHRDAPTGKPYFWGTSWSPKDQWAGCVNWGLSPGAQRGQSVGGEGWVTHRSANLHHYHNASWQMSPQGVSQSPGRVMQLGGTRAVNLTATGVR